MKTPLDVVAKRQPDDVTEAELWADIRRLKRRYWLLAGLAVAAGLFVHSGWVPWWAQQAAFLVTCLCLLAAGVTLGSRMSFESMLRVTREWRLEHGDGA